MSAASRPTKPIVPKRVRPVPLAPGPAPLEGARFVICVPDVAAQLEHRRWRLPWSLPLQAAAAVVSLGWLPRIRPSIDLWRLPLQLLSPQLWLQPKLLLPVICAVVLVLVAAIIQGNRASVDADRPDLAPEWRAPVVDLPPNTLGQQAATEAPPAAMPPQPSATAGTESIARPDHNHRPAAATNVASQQSPLPETVAGSNQPARIEPSHPEHRTAQLPERPSEPSHGIRDAQPPTAHIEGKILSAPADYRR